LSLDLNLLWNLQKCESEIHALEDELARLPKALEQAEAELKVREAELKAREDDRAKVVKKRKDLEGEIETLEQALRDNATKQIKAKSNEELNALKNEANFTKEKKSGIETQVLESFEADEQHAERIAEAKGHVDRAKALIADRQKEIDQKTAGLRAERDAKRKEADGLIAQLPPNIQSKFRQLVKAKSGQAVVPVQRGACGGCFTSLPPQFVNEVRKAERLQICEACGRILVWFGDEGVEL